MAVTPPIFLLDTNVLSELRKRRRCDPNVRDWFEQIPDDNVYTGVLVIGEIRRGIESLRRRDADTSNHLDLWLSGLERDFADRILPVNPQIADVWGRLNASNPLPVVDSLARRDGAGVWLYPHHPQRGGHPPNRGALV